VDLGLSTASSTVRPASTYFVGPNGNVVTIADLPSPAATRWVIRRKAEVVLAVHIGLLSLDEACARYRLTLAEFYSWQSAIERHGLLGLRATQVQRYRLWPQEAAAPQPGRQIF
jgi:hypothetical protein